jgi:hypothetical protein
MKPRLLILNDYFSLSNGLNRVQKPNKKASKIRPSPRGIVGWEVAVPLSKNDE